MIALGLFKVKSAWKLFSRMNDIDPEVSNKVSEHIDSYESAIKYADDDEKEDIHIEDFIPIEYKDIFNQSKDIRGIIDNIKQHPCSYLISSESIVENIGLIRVGSGANKVICAGIEGSVAESLGYLKNDWLTVTIVDIIDKIYKRIGIPQHTSTELVELCKDNQAVWDIYSNGHTFEVNQFTSPRTVKICNQFKPTNILEISALVAG